MASSFSARVTFLLLLMYFCENLRFFDKSLKEYYKNKNKSILSTNNPKCLNDNLLLVTWLNILRIILKKRFIIPQKGSQTL